MGEVKKPMSSWNGRLSTFTFLKQSSMVRKMIGCEVQCAVINCPKHVGMVLYGVSDNTADLFISTQYVRILQDNPVFDF